MKKVIHKPKDVCKNALGNPCSWVRDHSHRKKGENKTNEIKKARIPPLDISKNCPTGVDASIAV